MPQKEQINNKSSTDTWGTFMASYLTERPTLVARRMDYSNRALLLNNANLIHDEYWIHECWHLARSLRWWGAILYKRPAHAGIYRGRFLTQKITWRNVPGVFFFFYLLCNQVNRWYFEQFWRQRCMDITFNYSHKLNVKNNKFNKWKATF